MNYNKSTDFYSPVVAGFYHGTGFLNELGTLNYGVISTDLLKFNFRKGDHSISGASQVWLLRIAKTEIVGASGKGLPTGLLF